VPILAFMVSTFEGTGSNGRFGQVGVPLPAKGESRRFGQVGVTVNGRIKIHLWLRIDSEGTWPRRGRG